MTEIYRYPRLKQLSILMALDIAGPVAELVLSSIRFDVFPSTQDGSSLQNTWFYTVWTTAGIRLLIWSLILVTLSRLTGLCKSFGKAQVWFLLRFLAVFPEILAPAIFAYRHPNLGSLNETPLALLFPLLITAGAVLMGESLLLPLGDHAILCAGAELMESFGRERLARKNRRCGGWLLGTSLAFLLLFSSAVFLLVWIRYTRDVSLMDAEDGSFQILALLDIAAFLLALPLGLASLLLRVLAPVRMGQTYRAIEELTK